MGSRLEKKKPSKKFRVSHKKPKKAFPQAGPCGWALVWMGCGCQRGGAQAGWEQMGARADGCQGRASQHQPGPAAAKVLVQVTLGCCDTSPCACTGGSVPLGQQQDEAGASCEQHRENTTRPQPCPSGHVHLAMSSTATTP